MKAFETEVNCPQLPCVIAFEAGVLIEVVAEVKTAIRIGAVLKVDELHRSIIVKRSTLSGLLALQQI